MTVSDFKALDAEYRARVELVYGDRWSDDPDFERFVAALMDARRGPLDLIDMDDVRVRLTEDTVDGPRIAIEPHRYSAFWARAKSEGLVDFWRDDHGEPIYRPATTSTTGNNGKRFVVRRWTGDR